MQQAISQDDEYAEMLIRANKGQVPRGAANPSLAYWTTEAGLLADVKDSIATLISVTVTASSKKGASPPKVTPTPRPTTAMERVATRHRLRRHNALADRLLGERRQSPR